MGNNVTYLCWVSAFYVLNVALFVGRIFKYFGDDGPNAPIFLGLARGFGKIMLIRLIGTEIFIVL